MGRFQRAEAAGLIAFLACALFGMIVMSIYINTMPAIWQVTQRLFTMASGVVAACSMCTFVVGYLRTHKGILKKNWLQIAKHAFEIIALSTIYGATMLLMSFALLSIINSIIGRSAVNTYLPVLCCALSGIVGYSTLVQAELLEAKTVASLLPLFVISGAATAGLTSDDPYWYNNNFSQLGDRTTFAASMFNATLILAGICIIITSYFAITEFVATQHEILQNKGNNATKHFKTRTTIMAALLI
ncbi:ABC transporter permease, partial [Gardnerella vaginalis]